MQNINLFPNPKYNLHILLVISLSFLLVINILLLEKVWLSKPKTEENEKVPDPTSPTAKKEAPASPIPSEKVIPIPPLPNLQNDKKTVVEATILP